LSRRLSCNVRTVYTCCKCIQSVILSFFSVASVNICSSVNKTSSSAIAEGPCDALSQLKSCQLLHNLRKITFGYKDCPFMWYKNIAGRFFVLVTKHACDRWTELGLPRPRWHSCVAWHKPFLLLGLAAEYRCRWM